MANKTRITDGLISEMIKRREIGLSVLAISRELHLNPRTVTRYLDQARHAGPRKRHEDALASVESEDLKAHHRSIVIVSQAVGMCVMVDPKRSGQEDGRVLLDHCAEQQLLANADWLVERGIDLGSEARASGTSWIPDPSITFDEAVEEPVPRRLSRLLLEALYEHEPGLERAVGRWIKSWGSFQKGRNGVTREDAERLNGFAYDDVRTEAFVIRDTVDRIALYGRPPGACSLCSVSGL